TPKGKGGIDVTTGPDVELEDDTVREVLRERGYVNADVAITESVDLDGLLDGILENRVYLPSLVTVNKADLIEREYLDTVHADLREQGIDPEEAIFISAEEE
ncbi:GTP-binding protein, partial [Escherichia coli]|nr:GTP-binding protein [Escherichia coli]